MIKIKYDGERKGTVYYWGGNRWYGHVDSVSWWVRNIAPCIITQHKLTRMAIEQGYSKETFARPIVTIASKKASKKKVRKVKAKANDSFIPLF